MNTQEIQFLEENIIKLLESCKKAEIDDILDYLDYINKVRYSKKDIAPVLDKLLLNKKIILNNNTYLLK